MKFIIAKLFTSFLLGMALSGLHAQQTILSANNNATGSGGTVTYSVGQVAFITKTGVSGTITEGMQQPYEILYMTGIEEEKGITLDCILYPNPATVNVKLKIENHEIKNLNYQLYNMSGLLLQNLKIENNETTIPMDGLEHATYFLKVTENNKALQTFRIIKK
jgi:Secretion system C-terminal sorting domain